MQLKRYEVGDMAEALSRIKRDLGPDAIILSTRKIRKRRGIFGLVGQPLFEVLAAAEPEGLQPSSASSLKSPAASTPHPLPVGAKERGSEGEREGNGLSVSPSLPPSISPSPRGRGRGEGASASGLGSLQEELRAVRGEMRALQGRLGTDQGRSGRSRGAAARASELNAGNRPIKARRLPVRLKALHDQLISSGVAADVARQLVEEVQAARPGRTWRQDAQPEAVLKQVMIQKLKVLEPRAADGFTPSLMAFVGPTGVGKTTTIAKLAAANMLMAGKRVALVTLDTYRIAAVEQLKVYGKIIGTPVTVVLGPGELSRALRETRGVDMILIDTAGRCHRDAEQLWELKALLSQPLPIEVQLVLSATTREEEAEEMIKQFSSIPVHSLLFTKLDESGALGNLFNLAVRTAKPLSYLTTGQRVPEDIEVATPERIVDIVLHGFWR